MQDLRGCATAVAATSTVTSFLLPSISPIEFELSIFLSYRIQSLLDPYRGAEIPLDIGLKPIQYSTLNVSERMNQT
jgi:hypothetical protein